MSSFFFRNDKTESFTDRDCETFEEVSEALKYALLGLAYYKELHKKSFVWVPNCHSIVRGIALACPHLAYRSGYILGIGGNPDDPDDKDVEYSQMEHSWFKTRDGAIVDPYPMQAHARSEVLLIPTRGPNAAFGGNCYVEDENMIVQFGDISVWQQAQKFIELHRLGIARERRLAFADA